MISTPSRTTPKTNTQLKGVQTFVFVPDLRQIISLNNISHFRFLLPRLPKNPLRPLFRNDLKRYLREQNLPEKVLLKLVLKGRHANPDTLAFLACTPTRKRFPHSTVYECLKAFIRHASVFKRTDTLSTNLQKLFNTLAFLKR